MKRTPRGFAIYTQFKDSYGSEVRVQKSSSAEKDACWVFCKNATTELDGSPHLTKAQARRVARALLRFAEGER